MEFAASWKPLKKSNASATRMTRTRPGVTNSLRVLQDDGLEGVGDVLTAVDGRLHLIDDVLPLEDVHRLVIPGEQTCHRLPVHAVAFVLQPVALDQVLVQSGEPP